MHEIALRIGNPNLEVTNTSKLPAMTSEQLISNVGGLLGLWLGASLLTLVEICEFISSLVFCMMTWLARSAKKLSNMRRNAVTTLSKNMDGEQSEN